MIILQKLKMPLLEEAEKYVSEEKGVVCAEDAIAGAKDIIAESISDEADYRSWIRKITMKKGKLISTAKDPEQSRFMKCIMNSKNHCQSWQDTAFLR